MPGYVIHLAVAETYLKKTKIKENYEEFIEGVVAPDSSNDKAKTHYGKKSSQVHLDEFLKENTLDNSFNRGYFLHLITDYIFYNKVLDKISNDIYNDYDILNSYFISKYNVTIPEKVKHYAKFKEGKLAILSIELVEKCIELCSSQEIDDIASEITNPKFHDKWLVIKPLKRISDEE